MNQPTRLFDIPKYQQEHFPLEVMMSSKLAGEWKSYSTENLKRKEIITVEWVLAML